MELPSTSKESYDAWQVVFERGHGSCPMAVTFVGARSPIEADKIKNFDRIENMHDADIIKYFETSKVRCAAPIKALNHELLVGQTNLTNLNSRTLAYVVSAIPMALHMSE